jgi:hypothetical protein
VVGNPDSSVAEGDALRAAENERSADHAIRVWVHLRDRRAAFVALVVVAGPDEAGAKRDHGTEIDGRPSSLRRTLSNDRFRGYEPSWRYTVLNLVAHSLEHENVAGAPMKVREIDVYPHPDEFPALGGEVA